MASVEKPLRDSEWRRDRDEDSSSGGGPGGGSGSGGEDAGEYMVALLLLWALACAGTRGGSSAQLLSRVRWAVENTAQGPRGLGPVPTS